MDEQESPPPGTVRRAVVSDSRWQVRLCWLQSIIAVIAAFASCIFVESILASGPLMAAVGIWNGITAVRWASRSLLLFGAFGAATSGSIALLIGWFHWSPADAAKPIPVLLTWHAVVSTVWAFCLAQQLRRRAPLTSTAGVPQFSMRTLLGVVTAACVLLAIGRQAVRREWLAFAIYGCTVVMIAGALMARFAVRGRKAARHESLDRSRDTDATTAAGDQSCDISE